MGPNHERTGDGHTAHAGGPHTLARGTDVADRVRHQRSQCGSGGAGTGLSLERPRAGLAVQRAPVGANLPDDEAVRNFRYNAFYGADRAPVLDDNAYRLMLAGRIADKRPWTVAQLHALPTESQVTRDVCVEGWSMIGKWSGTPFHSFLERIGADTTSRYVGFECADGVL
jgi:DMSO/TMAO reductase YedYZ molybdopterin-dependent catalytic subunit